MHRRSQGEERRAAHAALAKVAPRAGLVAWHSAEAAPEPDESVAGALAEAANQYLGRSGVSAAGPSVRAGGRAHADREAAAARFIDAARAARSAGAPADRVRGLLARATALATAEITLVRAEFERIMLNDGDQGAAKLIEEMRVLVDRALGVDDDVACEVARVMSNDAILLGEPQLVRSSLALLSAVRQRPLSRRPVSD